jgi:hypothetical protein
MSNSNINKLAKYIVNHVNNRGKFYGKFPVSNGYIFTAPDITKDNIYFHLEKNNHTQRIYITFGKTNWADDGKWTIERYEDTHFVNEVTVKFTTPKVTIQDAKKLIKDLPKNDIVAYNQAFKILYPKL